MNFELYLASESPRRRELLEQAGYKFQVDSVKVSEIFDENLNSRSAIMKIAEDKAKAFVLERKSLKSKNILVLAADTMVVLEGRPLGKPQDFKQAREFLDLLSGKTHSVITGLCLWELSTDRKILEYDETLVVFKSLTPEQIETYVASGEPMGKAGAYAIQGKAKEFVASIQGSWSNVVGLPIEKFEKLLSQNGWQIEKK